MTLNKIPEASEILFVSCSGALEPLDELDKKVQPDSLFTLKARFTILDNTPGS